MLLVVGGAFFTTDDYDGRRWCGLCFLATDDTDDTDDRVGLIGLWGLFNRIRLVSRFSDTLRSHDVR